MPKKPKLFSDVTSVSRGNRIGLQKSGFLNKDDTVVGWQRLAPRLRDRELTQRCAKMLVLLELDQPEPRADLVRRLVSYLSYTEKEQTLMKVERLLTK